MKRTVSQSVFDSPQAKRVAKIAVAEANRQIEAAHARGEFDDGDPNHPKYNNGINYVTGKPATLFGYETDASLKRQY